MTGKFGRESYRLKPIQLPTNQSRKACNCSERVTMRASLQSKHFGVLLSKNNAILQGVLCSNCSISLQRAIFQITWKAFFHLMRHCLIISYFFKHHCYYIKLCMNTMFGSRGEQKMGVTLGRMLTVMWIRQCYFNVLTMAEEKCSIARCP